MNQSITVRMEKYLTLFMFQIKKTTTYRIDLILQQLASSIDTLIFMFIWSLNNGFSSNMKYSVLAYLLIGRAFQRLTRMTVDFKLADRIKSGSISKELLVPGNIGLRWFVEGFGERIISNISAVVVVLCLGLIFPQALVWAPNWESWLGFLIFVPIAMVINYFWQVIIGSISFWTTDTFGIGYLNIQFLMLFSGVAIPLEILLFGDKLIYNPFAFVFYHPVKIYLGVYSQTEILSIVAGGIFWCLFLYTLSDFIFKKGLSKNQSVGL